MPDPVAAVSSAAKAGKSLAAPIAALAISVVVALLLAPVKFGPLFYANTVPQIIANSGGMTGAAICFLVLPSLVWLLVRVGARPEKS